MKKIYDSNAMVKELKGIAKDYVNHYGSLIKLDYQQRLHEMGPGDVYPAEDDMVHTDKYKQEVQKETREAKQDVSDIIDRYEQLARDEMTEAPDPKALAYIKTMKERSFIDFDEFCEAVKKYGNNWTCFCLLKEICDEQSNIDKRYVMVNLVNTLDNFKQIGNMCRKAMDGYLDCAGTARMHQTYLAERLDTLNNALDTAVASQGLHTVDIGTLMSRGGWGGYGLAG